MDPKQSQRVKSRQISAGATAALLERFIAIRRQTEQLAAPLSPEDCSLQSMPDASPTKWHLAHTSWFFETFLLERFQADFQPFDPHFRVLFNSYYNGVGEKHPRAERGLISRPDLATVLAYRHHVTASIATVTAEQHDNLELKRLLTLGCHHEEQHQELILTDLKHLLSKNPQRPAYQTRWPLTPVDRRALQWLRFEGGLTEIGQGSGSGDGSDFSFDNEGPMHRVWIDPFELASHPVTHGDFAAFIADRGYQRPELWLSLGWDWVRSNAISRPLYWEIDTNSEGEDSWQTFTLHGMVPIDPNTPMCHINYFEADAYARWAGARLPRETEWELAAEGVPLQGNFVESHSLHPLAFREPTTNDTTVVSAQMFGDVWEWTQSAYLPYPGFQPEAGTVGEYNGKFMCNQFVLRGGSCATPSAHIRRTYRNFFPPDARWQFSGLRLARDV